ncbi:hypothetical protein D3C85_220670 [compost metagenome]
MLLRELFGFRVGAEVALESHQGDLQAFRRQLEGVLEPAERFDQVRDLFDRVDLEVGRGVLDELEHRPYVLHRLVLLARRELVLVLAAVTVLAFLEEEGDGQVREARAEVVEVAPECVR